MLSDPDSSTISIRRRASRIHRGRFMSSSILNEKETSKRRPISSKKSASSMMMSAWLSKGSKNPAKRASTGGENEEPNVKAHKS